MVYFLLFLITVLVTLGIAEALGEKVFDRIYSESATFAAWVWSVTSDARKQRFLAGALGPAAALDLVANASAPVYFDITIVAISLVVAYRTSGKDRRKEK